MFAPQEVIFAPTSQCNLHCAHCRVTRSADRLDVKAAIRFLESCNDGGIDRVGFSGGEPFLRVDFLSALTRAAVERGMLFDRLMTNGVWHGDIGALREGLAAVENAGFDGVYGLSIDSWHQQDQEKLIQFIQTAFELRGRRDCVEILSVQARDEGPCLEKLRAIAGAFDGELELARHGGEPRCISDLAWRGRPQTGEDLPGALFIDIHRFPYSAAMSPEGEGGDPGTEAARARPWSDEEWFEDDLCAGPGNVFYVHPCGDVAACCGFANENAGLILGNIMSDGYDELMAKAAQSPQVLTCYGSGLGSLRLRLEAKGFVFPGKTADQCYFCDWCAKKALFSE